MSKMDPIYPTILYLCRIEPVSRTQLNKLLFFCDLLYFIENGRDETITNEKYLKYQYGPVPENIDAARNSLIQNNLLIAKVFAEFSYENITTYEYKTANDRYSKNAENFLGSKKVKTIDDVYNALKHYSASKLSDISHLFEPWEKAKWYGKINFNLVRENDRAVQFLKDAIEKQQGV